MDRPRMFKVLAKVIAGEDLKRGDIVEARDDQSVDDDGVVIEILSRCPAYSPDRKVKPLGAVERDYKKGDVIETWRQC